LALTVKTRSPTFTSAMALLTPDSRVTRSVPAKHELELEVGDLALDEMVTVHPVDEYGSVHLDPKGQQPVPHAVVPVVQHRLFTL
jgi:hypothetical protein